MTQAMTLDNFGYLLDQVPLELIHTINNDINQVKRADNEMISGLTRPGSAKHFYLRDSIKPLGDYVLGLANIFNEKYNYLSSQKNLSHDTRFFVDKPWVNFQEASESIPNHSHGGFLSYTLWINLPEKSLFEFIYTNIIGNICTHKISLTKSDEGKILIFPAPLPHCVYSFSTAETRISVSGNIKFDPSQCER